MSTPAPGTPLPARRILEIGAVAAAVALVVLVGNAIWSHGAIYSGDPLSFLRVGRDPFGDGDALQADAAVHGIAYRYGRILFPLLGWVVAGGHGPHLAWTLPLVAVAAFGACAAIAAVLAHDAGQPPVRGLAVAAVPTLVTPTVMVYGEAVAFALLLGTYALYLRRHVRAAWVAAALVPLAREALLLALLPLAFDRIRTRGARAVLALLSAVLPAAVWCTWVRWRIGDFPMLDDSVSRREALGLPFAGTVRAISEGPPFVVGVAAVLTAAVAAVTFVVAVIVVVRHRTDRLLSAAALVTAALGLCLGAQAYRFPIDGLRVLAPPHVLLAVIAVRANRGAGPVAVPADPCVDIRDLAVPVAAR